MAAPAPRAWTHALVPHVVVLALLTTTSGGAATASAQSADWRDHFAAGQAALEDGEPAAYAREMAAAVDLMPEGLLNRPFAQYHAARGWAMAGRPERAAAFLGAMLDEDIEALMASFAEHDPAFAAVRDHPAYRAAMARMAGRELTVRPLPGALHLVEGAGANLVASVGRDGVLLVDTGYRAALPGLRAALAGLGAASVDVLVLTHPHEDHWGAAEALGAEARILAHPGTRDAMAEPYTFIEGVVLPPRDPVALPDATPRDTTFTFNGERVRVIPVEAHTGADLAVLFEDAGVLHLGDAWLAGNPVMFPGADDPDGFLDGVERLLDRLPARDHVILGGHDRPARRAEVRAQIEATRTLMADVRAALDDGMDLDETVRALGDRWPAPWIRYFHRTLGGG